MKIHSFEIYFTAPADDLGSEDGVRLLDALVSHGLDDASVAQMGDDLFAIVDREAGSFVDAVMTAFTQTESTDGCAVLRVLPQDLVSATEIARRHGKTRQWVNNLIKGKRGSGDFPKPFALRGAAAHWRWSDIEDYFAEGVTPDEAEVRAEAVFLETLNAALHFRNRSRELSEMSRDADTQRVVDAVLQGNVPLSA